MLFGKLSLVGSKIIEVKETQHDVHSIELKPGLTGLVQINEKNSKISEDLERYNLFYLKNYSIQLDIEIIVKFLLGI